MSSSKARLACAFSLSLANQLLGDKQKPRQAAAAQAARSDRARYRALKPCFIPTAATKTNRSARVVGLRLALGLAANSGATCESASATQCRESSGRPSS